MDNIESADPSLKTEIGKFFKKAVKVLDGIVRTKGFNDDTPDDPHQSTLEKAYPYLRKNKP